MVANGLGAGANAVRDELGALAEAADARPDLFVEAAQVVHGPEPLERKLEWVLDVGAIAAGEGTTCAYAGFDSETGEFWTVAGSTVFELLNRRSLGIEIRGAARAGRPARYGSVPATLRGRPGAPVSLLIVPVMTRTGGAHGALLLGHLELGHFTEALEGVLSALAVHLGVALDNLTTMQRLAELEAAQREVVHQLQEAVRPPTPVVPGAELGVYYLAADPAKPTGGDLYDWLVLPDGDLHLVVVDVMGHGVGATKDALAVTHVLRLLVLDGTPLERLVTRADALVTAQSADLVATLVVGRYTPSTGVLRLAGAGHPPPLVVTADGRVREVTAPGIPIGWPGAGTGEVVTLTLERSDTVVLYTDGLIEATKDIIEGLDALATAAARTSAYPARHMARALVNHALEGADRRDDTLALVLRRRSPPAPGDLRPLGPFQYRFSATTAAVSLARGFLADWLGRQPVDAVDTTDLLLVASELCANAVRAASDAPGAIVLKAWSDGDAIIVEVEDDGAGFELPRPADVPDPTADTGRGLFLVESLTDELTVRREGTRTIVRVVKTAVLGSHGGSPSP